jgi:hypothetical protein
VRRRFDARELDVGNPTPMPKQDETSRARATFRRIAARRSVQRAVGWAAVLLLAGLLAFRHEIKHPPLPLKILFGVYLALGLVGLICLAADAAKVARDWLWNRRQDWRDSRRGERGHDRLV